MVRRNHVGAFGLVLIVLALVGAFFIGTRTTYAKEALVEVVVEGETEEEAPVIPDTGALSTAQKDGGASAKDMALVISVTVVIIGAVVAVVIWKRRVAGKVVPIALGVFSLAMVGGFLMMSVAPNVASEEAKDLDIVSDPTLAIRDVKDVAISLSSSRGWLVFLLMMLKWKQIVQMAIQLQLTLKLRKQV